MTFLWKNQTANAKPHRSEKFIHSRSFGIGFEKLFPMLRLIYFINKY